MTEKIKVPPGSPPWVTNKLIADTIRVWQPHYKKKITEEDALEILINVCQLSNNLDLTKTTQPSTSPVSAVSQFDDHFEKTIRKHMERPYANPRGLALRGHDDGDQSGHWKEVDAQSNRPSLQ
jgi:hypothetical protein